MNKCYSKCALQVVLCMAIKMLDRFLINCTIIVIISSCISCFSLFFLIPAAYYIGLTLYQFYEILIYRKATVNLEVDGRQQQKTLQSLQNTGYQARANKELSWVLASAIQIGRLSFLGDRSRGET